MRTLSELHHPPHLRLTLQEESDAGALFSLVQQEKSRLRLTLPWPDSVTCVADTLNTIKANRREFAAGAAAVYIIRWDGDIVGIVSFNTIRDREGVIGYWIAEPFEGKGIVSLAVRTMVNAYINAGVLNKCFIRASVANPRSNALAQRVGFRFHHQRKNAEKIGDRCFDQNVYCYPP